MNGALLRLESSIFLRVTFFFFQSSLFLQFTGLEKTQADDVPQNDLVKDAATGAMAGNVVVCFAN